MDAELTDPLGRLSPLYDLGTELTIRPRGGGTGSNIKDSDIAETLANRPNLFGTTQEQAIDDAVKTARGVDTSGQLAANEDRALKGLAYETAQHGPFYRVYPRKTGEERSVFSRTGEEIWPGSPSEAPRGGSTSYGTSQHDPVTGTTSPLMPTAENNVPLQAANKYVKSINLPEFSQPEMPRSSLAKQSAIGRTFNLAAEGSPEYKAAIFEAYGKMMPDVVEKSGAQNYDQLLEAAYRQMAKETSNQFDALPLRFSFHRAGEGNYENSPQMVSDVHNNGHLFVYQGGDKHDFLHNIDPETGLNENEKFRAVHDAFGHAILGNTFGPQGEERAWAAHSRMYSPLAQLAMTAETRGQNSVVNYTPLNMKTFDQIGQIEMRLVDAIKAGNANEVAALKAAKTEAMKDWQFAPNKAVLLPPEFLSTEYTGGMPNYIRSLIRPEKGTTLSSSLAHFSRNPNMTMTDPSRYGTGLKGAERERLNTLPGGVLDRSYFYLGDPRRVSPEPGLGPVKYSAKSENLYDWNKDPSGLWSIAQELNRAPATAKYDPAWINMPQAMNDVERLAKEYGYSGIANSKHRHPMAVMFDPTPVQKVRADGGRVGYATLGAVQEDDDSDITDALRLTKTSAPTGDPSADAMQRVLLSGEVSPPSKPYDLGQQIQEGIQTAKDLYGSYKGNVAEANRSAGDLQRLAVENMRSGSPGRMLLGAGQDILAPVAGVMAPLTGGLETARQGIEYRLGAGPANAFEVASNILQGPEDIVNAARLAAKSAPTLAHVAEAAPAVAMTLAPGRKATEAAAVTAPNRELSPLGFYSHGAEAAMALPQATGSVDQMIAMLRKQPGVTEAELKNAGLLTPEGQVNPEWLAKGKIGREDIASHLQSRMPQVEETVLRRPNNPYPYLNDEEWMNAIQTAERRGDWDEALNINQVWESLQGNGPSGMPKYGQYTLPGGENYREVLLRMPNAGDGGATDWVPGLGRVTQPHPDARQAPAFRSPHWDESNVLAHIRMADRTGPNGEKILHVEEVQSDWGQKGKKQGFKNEEDIKKLEKLDDEIKNLELWNPKDQEKYVKLSNERLELKDKTANFLSSAPYVTSTQGWTDLALKRILKEAAEGGYDKVVWTPGVEQASRYDLSKQISKVQYDPNEQTLFAYDHEGKMVINERGVETDDLEKYIGKDPAEKLMSEVHNSTSTLDEYDIDKDPETGEWGLYLYGEPMYEYGGEQLVFGSKSEAKDYLQELVNQEIERNPPTISGLDLQVGGEGMKEYYDKILPNRLQSLAKKHDKNAKVGVHNVYDKYDILDSEGRKITTESNLESAQNYLESDMFRPHVASIKKSPMEMLGIDITPQMRESILRGQGAFKKGGRVNYATKGAVEYEPIELPNSLKELQNWTKTHPAQLTRNSMENVFTNRISALEGEKPIAMPANLRELQDWDKISHDHALNLARKLYDSED